MKNKYPHTFKVIYMGLMLSCFLLSQMMFAQENIKFEFSLDSAIDYAMENNYDVLNTRLSIDAAN
ncbi:MAG: hypothetical protein KAS18_03675, partial [Calditrichia bacterium]|nr:hypothetical protein [Calditrichia bacterium]